MAAFRPSKLPRATTLPPLAELFDDKSNSTMPRAGALTAVEYHQQWLESYAAAAAADVGSQHATRYREATRFIASNQIAGWDFSPALEAAVAAGSSPSTSKFVDESLPLLVPALVDPDEVRHLREHLRSLQAATTLLCARLRAPHEA